MLGRLVSRGMIMSGQTVSETAKIGDDRIRSMVDAKLETVMESDDFYRIPFDEARTAALIDELLDLRARRVHQAERVPPRRSEFRI
jgi:hypothetical protein